jgi:hypothetical protein
VWDTNFELKDLFFGGDTVQQSGFNLSLFSPVLAVYFEKKGKVNHRQKIDCSQKT